MDKSDERFNELIIEMSPKVLRFVKHWCRDWSMAEDIAQEVFETVYVRRERLLDHENPRGWIMKIAKHKILKTMLDEEKYYERMVPLDEVVESRIGHECNMTDGLIAEEILSRLSKGESHLLHAYYVEGHSASQMSKELDISVPAFRMRLNRAKKKLRKLMKMEEYI